jgi:hypothetical protein
VNSYINPHGIKVYALFWSCGEKSFTLQKNVGPCCTLLNAKLRPLSNYWANSYMRTNICLYCYAHPPSICKRRFWLKPLKPQIFCCMSHRVKKIKCSCGIIWRVAKSDNKEGRQSFLRDLVRYGAVYLRIQHALYINTIRARRNICDVFCSVGGHLTDISLLQKLH